MKYNMINMKDVNMKYNMINMKGVESTLMKAMAKITEDLYGETACICKDLKPSSLCIDHMDKLCHQFK